MIGVSRLKSQMLPCNGKFEHTGIGSERKTSAPLPHGKNSAKT